MERAYLHSCVSARRFRYSRMTTNVAKLDLNQGLEPTPEEVKADEEKLFTEGDAGHDYSLDFLQIKEDDPLYKVPEDETADFVGIGSLGHIIRKCFKDIYRPGQEDDDMLPKTTEDGEEGEETEETNNEKHKKLWKKNV